jgi:hypothetical protein
MSSKVGNISFYDSSGQSDFGFTKPYSEKTAELIDSEVKLIIEKSYVRAKEVLTNNMKGLTELAELLLEKEVIFTEDLERIFGKRKADQLKEEREALAKPKISDEVKIKEGGKIKKAAGASARKIKTKPVVKKIATKIPATRKTAKKSKTEGKE